MDVLCEEAGGSDGVVFSPDMTENASITGLSLKSTRGNIIYALYEGVSREIAALAEEMGGARNLRVFGGGSKSEIWCKILADTAKIPVVILNTPETASRGAAMLASGMKLKPAPAEKIINPVK